MVETTSRRSAEEAFTDTRTYLAKLFCITTGVTSNSFSTTGDQSSMSRYYVGWNTPNFHARRRRGELLPYTEWRQFTMTARQTGCYDNYFTEAGKSYRHYVVGNHTPWQASSYSLSEGYLAEYVPSAYDKYVQEAAAKIYSSGFDALTFLTEFSDIPKLFTSMARKIATLDFPRNWRSLGGDWLNSRYGWRTLLYDIDEISQMIAEWNVKTTGKFANRISERGGNTYSTSSKTVTDGIGYYYYYRLEDTIDVNVSVRGSVTAEIKVPKLQFNPLQTAWERIPFSFVVDWVVGVGKSISALSFLATQTKYFAAKSYVVEANRTRYVYVTAYKPGVTASNDFVHGESTAKLVVRTPCKVSLTPHLTMNWDFAKIVDLLGIIVQKSRR